MAKKKGENRKREIYVRDWGKMSDRTIKDLKEMDKRQRILVLIGICKKMAWVKEMKKLGLWNGSRSGRDKQKNRGLAERTTTLAEAV